MKIERIFNNDSKLTLEDIIFGLIDEKVDTLLRSNYHENQVNTALSHDERTNAA